MGKMTVLTDITELMTMNGALAKEGRHIEESDLGVIKRAAMVFEKGRIVWVGQQSKVPRSFRGAKRVSANGHCVFPGWVDCHTHLLFAGDRRHEFEERIKGKTYQQIAEAGGGIQSTVKQTRQASLNQLIAIGEKRLQQHLAQGVTTVEIKSGYGLTSKDELKLLRAAQSLRGAHVVTTFLGAHAIPSEFKTAQSYLEQLKMDLKTIKNKRLSDRVDIFVEKGYFSIEQARDYLLYAQSLGFQLVIHADQLTAMQASLLAVELGALSADHVICLSDNDKRSLAQSSTVAVLLPSADFYLQCSYPDARALIDQGGCVALATDFNPGSSPSQSIALVGLLARLKMRMQLPEIFCALTYGGAKALGLEKERGVLQAGYSADFFLSPQSHTQWFYDIQSLPVVATYVAGKRVFHCK